MAISELLYGQGKLICRFAPSPNGLLHLGHAYSALLNARLARAHKGLCLLRIEDIDRDRSKPRFEDALREDLAWLGLDWPRPERRQSEFFAAYRAILEELAARGLAYPCFCSRGSIAARIAGKSRWPADPDGSPVYPGICRDVSEKARAGKIAAGLPHTLRIDMARALEAVAAPLTYREFHESETPRLVTADPALWGDAVIGRRDAPASYHLACVHDDAAQGITDVMRGSDLEPATSLHVLLQTLLGYATPDYRHHRLVLDADGKKLAKSKSAVPLRELRAQGVTPDGVRAMLAEVMGTVFG